MTHIKVKGFKIFRDKKPPYSERCYHRKTGHKIDLALAPVGSAAFFAECAKIAALAQAMTATQPRAGTLGALLGSYFSEQHFINLADRTRSDYRKVADYLDPVLDTSAHLLDTPLVAGIHAKALSKIGWRQANILRTLLVEVFRYAIPKGMIRYNPALAVILHPRPKDRPRANRPWEIAELEFVLTTAKSHVAAVVALIANTGLDPSDALNLRRDALKDGVLWAWRGKTGEPVALPVGRRLQGALTAASGHDAITILATSKGLPWSYNGFSTVWHRFKQKQVEVGLLPSDLTLKGLRHMVATILRECGMTPRQIADLLGQKTEAMALHYSRDASLADRNRATMEAFDTEAEKRTAVVKLAAKSVKPN